MDPLDALIDQYAEPVKAAPEKATADSDLDSLIDQYSEPTVKKKEDTDFALETGSLEFPDADIVPEPQAGIEFKIQDFPEGVKAQQIDLTPIEDLLTSLDEKSQLTPEQEDYIEGQIIKGMEPSDVSATFLRTGVQTPSVTDYERQRPELAKLISEDMGVPEDQVSEEAIKEMYSDKKRFNLTDKLRQQNREDYVEDLSASDKDKLEDYKNDLGVDLANKSIAYNMEGDRLMNRVEQGDYANGIEASELVGKAYENWDKARESFENLETVEKEIDLLKRNYGTAENIIGKATASTLEILSGASKFVRDIEPIANPLGYVAKMALGVQDFYDEAADKSEDILERLPENIKENLRRTKSVSDIRSVGDFAEWATDITSETAPQILTIAATGGSAGLGILGASAYGNKLNQLESEEEIAGKELYSPFQKRAAAALTAGAVLASESVTRGILNKGKRVMQSAMKGGVKSDVQDQVKKSLTEKITNAAKGLWVESDKEAWSEVGEQLSENIVDKYMLGKEDVNIYDGLTDVYAAGKLMGLLMHAAPQIGAEVIEPFVSQNTRDQIGNNLGEIIELSQNYGDLPDAAKVIIEEQVAERDAKNNKIIDDEIKAIANLPKEQAEEVVRLDGEMKIIEEKAEVVRNDEVLNNVQKTTTLNSLRSQYEQVSKQKNQIVENSKQEVNRTRQEKEGEEKFEEALTKEEPRIEPVKEIRPLFDKTISETERANRISKKYKEVSSDIIEDIEKPIKTLEVSKELTDKYESLKSEIDERLEMKEIDRPLAELERVKRIFNKYEEIKEEVKEIKEKQKPELLTQKPKKDDVQIKKGERKEKVAIVKEKPRVRKRKDPEVESGFQRRYQDEILIADKQGLKGEKWTYAEGKFRDDGGKLIPKPSAEIQKEFKDQIVEMSEKVPAPVAIKEVKKIDVAESIGLNKAISFFDDFDKDLGKFGKEVAGVGMPIVIARGSVKTIKAGLQAGKTVADAISDGLNYMRETGWYKNLSDKQKKKFDENFEEELEKSRDEALKSERERKERKPSEERVKEIELEKELNKNIREPEKAKGLVAEKDKVFFAVDNISEKAKGEFLEYFRTRGHLPRKVFDEKVGMTAGINSRLKELKNTVIDFKRAVKKTYGKEFTADDKFDVDLFLRGDKDINELPEGIQDVVSKMREDIDALSEEMVESGVVQGDLIGKLTENLGTYLTRSYQIYDDPKWKDKVPQEIKNKAISFLRKEFPGLNETELEGLIYELLTEEDAPLAFLRGGKLGSKDLTVLKKRKDIPVEIRMLLGEYKDPLVNYARSVTKMTNLIERHKFLTEIRAEGEGDFLFKRPQGEKYVYKIAAEGSQTMNPLNGMYTSKEVKEAFESFDNQVRNFPGWLRTMMILNGVVKYGKTVGSFMGHVRNFTSNILVTVKNGNLGGGDLKNAYKTIITDLGGLSNQEFREKYKKYMKLGVVNDDASIGEVKGIIRDAIGEMSDVDLILDQHLNWFKRGTRKGLSHMNKAYQGGDDFWKVYNFEAEREKYKKAFPEWTDEQLDKKAANIVRNTMPTYSLTPKIVKTLRHVPFMGTFVSFPAEVIRTTYNSIELAKNEMKDKETRSIGAKRAGGIMAATFITGASTLAMRYLNNVDEQEDEDARRFLPPWTKNSQIIWLDDIKNGKGKYVDLAYSDPMGMLKKPVVAAIANDTPVKSFVTALKDEVLGPFIGEEMLVKAIREVMSNKKEGVGTNIYNKTEPLGDQFSKIATHLLKPFEPGTVSSLKRIWKGAFGEVVEGKEYNLVDESVAMMTGQRRSNLDIKTSMSVKSYVFSKDKIDARKIYTKAKYNKALSKEEVDAQYNKAQDAYDKLFKEFQKDYEAAVRLGVPPKELNRMMKGKMSKKERKAVRRGEKPPELSK